MLYSQVKKAIQDSDVETVREVLADYGEYVLESGIECDVAIADIAEAYNGEYASDIDFTMDLLEGIGAIPKDFPTYIYIDWEGTARDIMLDYSEHNGHYFRCL